MGCKGHHGLGRRGGSRRTLPLGVVSYPRGGAVSAYAAM